MMESCRDPPAEELVQTIDGVIRDGRLDGNLPTPSRRVEPKGKSLLSLGLTIAVLMLAFVGVLIVFQDNLSDMLLWFEKPLLFGALFIPVSYPVFLVGYWFLNLGAGYIYGNFHGFLITSAGTFVGTILSFFSLRYMCRGYVLSVTEKNTSLKRIMKVVDGEHGWKVMMMTRLTPVPMGVQNSIFAGSNMDAKTLIFGSLFALMPTQILNTYMGSSLRSIEDVIAGNADNSVAVYAELFVALAVTWYVNQKMKDELDKEIDREEAALEQRLLSDELRNGVQDTLDNANSGSPSRGLSSMRRSRSSSELAGISVNSDMAINMV